MEAHVPAHVDPRISADLSTKRFKPAGFIVPQTPSTCYSDAGDLCTCASESKAPQFAILLVQEASLHTKHGGPALTTKLFCQSSPTASSKSRKQAPTLCGNLLYCGSQETFFPKAQYGPGLPTVPNNGRTPSLALKSKNTRLPSEGMKDVNFYSMCDTRMLVPPRSSVTQYVTPHMPAGESNLP
jgi:hypothetical protein